MKRRFFVGLLFGFLFLLSLGGLSFYKWVLSPQEGRAFVIDEAGTYPAEQINAITINTTRADVQITRGEGDEIRLELTGKGKENGSGNATLKSEQTGDQLAVSVQQSGSTLFSRNSAQLQVVLPARQFDRLQVKTASGDMRIEEASATSLDISSVSGDIQAEGLTGNELTVKTTSGDIIVDTWTGNATVTSVSGDQELIRFKEGSLSSSTTSGEVDVMDLTEGQDLRITTVSGDVEVEGELANGQISTTSGEITVNAGKLDSGLTLQSVSGDLRIELPTELPFSLESKTVSGDLKVDSADFTYTRKSKNQVSGSSGDGGPKLQFKTTSGDMQVSN